MGGGVPGGTKEAEPEALKATRAALRHVGDVGQPTDKGKPSGVIIFIINCFQAVCGGIADQFIAADGIFPERDDVGVAEEYSRTQTLADHPFDDGGRAWGAAAMQQDALLREVAAIRRFWTESLFMNIPVRHFNYKFNNFSSFRFLSELP